MRVAMRVLEDASYADDPLIVEYLGGVLASSHTLVGRDDRGAAWTSVIESMSTYQLRAHYVIYREFRRLTLGESVPLDEEAGKNAGMTLYIPLEEFNEAMAFSDEEDSHGLGTHAIFGLLRHEFLDGFALSPTLEGMGPVAEPYDLPQPGLLANVTAGGAELFLWAHGHGSTGPNELTNPDLRMVDTEAEVAATPSACLLRDF